MNITDVGHLVSDGDERLVSQHAGYTDDEIYIPLIIIDKT